jgi:hypothetical protein
MMPRQRDRPSSVLEYGAAGARAASENRAMNGAQSLSTKLVAELVAELSTDPAHDVRDSRSEPVLERMTREQIEALCRPDVFPSPMHSAEPMAVLVQWLVAGVVIGSYFLARPLTIATDALAHALPAWEYFVGAAALGALCLAVLERAKRNRRGLLLILDISAAALVVAALTPDVFPARAPGWAWHALCALLFVAALHLALIEDWLDGRSGPRARALLAAVRDLATLRWWAWSSKVALAHRARQRQLREILRQRRELAVERRRREEEDAAAADALRRRQEAALLAVRAEEAAARAERCAAEERLRTTEALRKAAEAEEARCAVELRVAEARSHAESMRRTLEELVVKRTRLETDRLEAEQRYVEVAVMARDAARCAVERKIEADRALELLFRVEAQLACETEAAETDDAADGARACVREVGLLPCVPPLALAGGSSHDTAP